MRKTMETVEPGIFRRVDPRSGKVLPKLWVPLPWTQRTHRTRADTHNEHRAGAEASSEADGAARAG